MVKSNMKEIRTHLCESIAWKPFFNRGLNHYMTISDLKTKRSLQFLFCTGHYYIDSYLE